MLINIVACVFPMYHLKKTVCLQVYSITLCWLTLVMDKIIINKTKVRSPPLDIGDLNRCLLFCLDRWFY